MRRRKDIHVALTASLCGSSCRGRRGNDGATACERWVVNELDNQDKTFVSHFSRRFLI
jgi:hypothetical protein